MRAGHGGTTKATMPGRDEMETLKPSVVVVGAGAAGLVAAAFAAAARARRSRLQSSGPKTAAANPHQRRRTMQCVAVGGDPRTLP